MELFTGAKKDAVRGDFIRRAVRRTDLVPIPLTLELDVRVDADSVSRFAVGESLWTGADEELEIIKAERARSNRNAGQEVAQHMRVTAILKPVAPAVFVQDRAIIKYAAALSEVYRACKCTVRSIEGDFAIPSYVCTAGEAPTFGIARACQEAGGVVRWRRNKLHFTQLDALFEQRPSDNVFSTATQDVESGFLERHDIPSFYSVDEDGAPSQGDRRKARNRRYQPRADAGALRRMTGVLVLAKVARMKYTETLSAGDLLTVDNGSADPLVALTVASLYAPGADGDEPQQYSRVWLGRLVS